VEVLRVPEGVKYRLGRREKPLAEIEEELVSFANRSRDLEAPGRPSNVRLHIRADARLPWGAVRRILDLCRKPEVGIHHLEFAGRRPWRGENG
jgi:hypothetical protein